MESLIKTTASIPAAESTRLSAEDMRAVDKVREILTAKMCDCPQIAELAKMTGTSASKLQTDFKTVTGMTIHDYVCEERMKHARDLLQNSEEPIYRVASAVGCKKPGHFAKLFKARFGQTPTEHRKTAKAQLSVTLESYLDAIYELSTDEHGARLTDVALRMDVKKSTASAAIATLTQKGLVEDGHYRQIALTKAGVVMARRISGKHKVVRQFFREVLGVDEITADSDACAIEHVISSSAIAAMWKMIRAKAKEDAE